MDGSASASVVSRGDGCCYDMVTHSCKLVEELAFGNDTGICDRSGLSILIG